MPKRDIDLRILALCDKVTAKRPRTVIDHIIEHGAVTTEELQVLYGYDHPPRAVRDVRESGIPIQTFRVRSDKTGRMIAAYRFDSPDKIVRGRIGGRKAFSKRFKDALIERYGARDAITGEQCAPRYLQMDHRIPYEVAGELVHDENDTDAYMRPGRVEPTGEVMVVRAMSELAGRARRNSLPLLLLGFPRGLYTIHISRGSMSAELILSGAARKWKPLSESATEQRGRTRPLPPSSRSCWREI